MTSGEPGTPSRGRSSRRLAIVALALLFAEMLVVSGTYEPLLPIATVRARHRNSKQDLLLLITDTLGARPADCGQFFLTKIDDPDPSAEQLRAAVSCLLQRSVKREPAFVVVQLHGIDSWTVYGLMARSDGKIVLYEYSDPYGGAEPDYSEWRCAAGDIRVTPWWGGEARITCRREK